MSAQVPNDEEFEEDQEPDAPSIQVDLAMLRKTLTSHVDAKLRIEADIPAEAITAGACELNAFALRTELGDKPCGNQRVCRLARSSGEEHRIATPSSRRRVDGNAP